MDQERRTHLLDIISNAAKAHRVWVEQGDSTMVPEDEIYQRFQEVADQSRVINRHRAEPLEQLILAFAPHWQAFVSAQQINADATMLPSQNLWAAWEQLNGQEIAARTPKLKRIEPIADLKAQKVPDWQICKIYGFEDDAGQPDFLKLQEEVETPGKHTGPGTGWVAPVNRQLAAQIRQMEVETDALNRRRTAKVAAATTPAPESIESLVSGPSPVSASQIARMKRMSVEQVYQYCAEHDLPKPPYDYSSALQAPGAHDPSISPERQQAMDNLGRNTSPQFAPQHPLRDRPDLGQADEVEDDAPELPSGIDLSELPPEEANQIQEAVGYFNQGMDLKSISAAMGGLHGNSVRSLLKKGGVELSPAGAT